MKPVHRILLSLVIAGISCQVFYLFAIREFNKSHEEQLTEVLTHDTPFDCLLLGSSSIHYFVNPSIFRNVSGLNGYNCGVDAACLPEFSMLLDAYLLRHPSPRYLILTLDLGSFDLTRKIANPALYLPYFSNPIIASNLRKNAPRYELYRYIPFLLFSEKDFPLLAIAVQDLSAHTGMRKGAFQYQGYSSNFVLHLTDKDTLAVLHPEILDKEATSFLETIIKTCELKHITLILTTAPEYNQNYQRHVSNSAQIFGEMSRVASEHAIELWREDTLSICKFKECFFNPEHLNTVGAVLYSKIIGEQMNDFRRRKEKVSSR
jgi:hypothetical protein